MHLDSRFHRIVRILDVGVTTADVGNYNAILALQSHEQVVRGVCIGSLVDTIDRIGNLRVRGAVDGLAFVAIVHVAVAADRGVCGPLITRDAHKSAGLVECLGKRVELAPERSSYLEIVALVSHHI
jgi:hypothetical protein